MSQIIETAIYCQERFGPTFGGGYDICICDRTDINKGSFTNLGGLNYKDLTIKTYLAGTYDTWLTVEIEVFPLRY